MNSIKYGNAIITSLGAKIWKSLPNGYKELAYVLTFKSKITNLEKDKCHCRLWKTYIQWVGFIWLGIITFGQCLLNIFFLFFYKKEIVAAAVVVCLLVVAVLVVDVFFTLSLLLFF